MSYLLALAAMARADVPADFSALGPTWGVRFPSGLALVVHQDAAHPVVSVVTVIGAGQAADPAEREGLAHLVEHLWFRSHEPGEAETAEVIASLGGEFQAQTRRDETVYSVTAPRAALDRVLAVEGWRLRDALRGVTDEVLASEQRIVENEVIERQLATFEGFQRKLISRMFPRSHAYSKLREQSARGMGQATMAQARAWIGEHYLPGKSTLFLTGDVPDAQAILTLLDAAMGSQVLGAGIPTALVRDADVRVTVDPPLPRSPGFHWEVADLHQPVILLGWTLPPGRQADDSVLEFAAHVVERFVDFAARIQEPEVFERGDGAACGLDPRPLSSTLVCEIPLRWTRWPDEVAYTVVDVVSDLLQYRDDDVDELFEDAKADAFVGLLAEAEAESAHDPAQILESGIRYHYSGMHGTPASRAAALERVVGSDVISVARNWVTRGRAVGLGIVPRHESARVGADRLTAIEPAETHATSVAPSFDAALASHAAALDPAAWREETLDNGLRVVLAHEGEFPAVYASLVLPGGQLREPRPGASRLLWALTEVPAAKDRKKLGEKRRTAMARLYASSSESDHTYGVVTQPARTGLALELLSAQVRKLRIGWGDWGAYRKASRLSRNERDAGGLAYFLARERSLRDHPLVRRRARLGIFPLFDPMSAAITELYRGMYRPDGATLYVVGPFDAEAVMDEVEEAFGRWRGPVAPKDPLPELAGPPDPVARGIRVIEDAGADPATVVLACQLAPDPKGSDAPRRLSRALAWDYLWRRARQASGWTYTPMASSQAVPGGTQLMELALTVRPDAVADATALLFEVTDGLAKGNREMWGDEDLARARSRQVRELESSRRSGDGILGAIEQRDRVAGSRTELGRDLVELGLAGRAEVSAAMARCVGNESVVVAAPAKAIAAVRERWPEWVAGP